MVNQPLNGFFGMIHFPARTVEFATRSAYLGWVRRRSPRSLDWERLARLRPQLIVFWQRSSPRPLVNPILARYYGMPGITGGSDHWVRVDHARDYERGGLLPMAVFLTQNAPGLRTSPVKRGLFILDNILGTPPAPPPPDIPPLEDAIAGLKGKPPTLRETLKIHRSESLCSSCMWSRSTWCAVGTTRSTTSRGVSSWLARCRS